MHVRVTRRRRGPKTYRSVQLVQSYRRADGMPANKVLASFGNLGELETENLKLAVKASREGRSVVLSTEGAATAAPKVRRNLAFLDVASCLRTWQRWGLTELLDELAPSSKREVSFGDVVAALAIQRCVAPASKLEASRWYKTTALPELLGVSSRRFNNTRIHRVLETLDAIEAPLQRKLAHRVERQQGQFVSLFLDCTDTWFVGRGPELAKLRTTKEGLARRRIGIALMCNEDGFPLRWATVSGDFNEPKTMLDMVDEVSSLSWADKLPVVVDRAMGRGVTVEALLARDVHFITAVPSPEIAKHSARIPVARFDDIDVSGDDDDECVLQALEARAIDAGLVRSGDRYLFELGLFTKGEGGEEKAASWLTPSRALATLRLAHRARVDMDSGETIEVLAERYDCSTTLIHRALVLNGLVDELQERVLAGEADRITPGVLRTIAKLPTAARQRAAFEQAHQAAGEGPVLKVTRELARLCGIPGVKLRGAVVFSPAVFVRSRRAMAEAIDELERAVHKANEQLQSKRHRTKREKAVAKVAEVLKRYKLRDVYEVICDEPNEDEPYQLRLERNDHAWARKRALDGLSLIIAHPEVKLSAEALVTRYFAKDKVEKDFQAIKSVLELRPVNHQTDPKVRAHVTLCVLALLLERAIEHQLRASGLDMTGPHAVHLLQTAKLNLYAGDVPIYSATEPDPEQKRILAALGLENLTNDERLAETLTPRA